MTTDTSYIFGDNENGIQFPLITICSQDFSEQNQLMKDCKSGSHDFIGSFIFCMKANSNYQINSFLDGLRLDIRKLVAKVVIWTGSEHIYLLDGLYDQAWSMIFHYALGLCYTFDPKTFRNGLVPIKYHAHNGQIHRTEIHIEFDVR